MKTEPGPGRPGGTLSPEVLENIRTWYSEGFSVPSIRLELSVQGIDLSYHTVYNIAKGRTYTDSGSTIGEQP